MKNAHAYRKHVTICSSYCIDLSIWYLAIRSDLSGIWLSAVDYKLQYMHCTVYIKVPNGVFVHDRYHAAHGSPVWCYHSPESKVVQYHNCSNLANPMLYDDLVTPMQLINVTAHPSRMSRMRPHHIDRFGTRSQPTSPRLRWTKTPTKK